MKGEPFTELQIHHMVVFMDRAGWRQDGDVLRFKNIELGGVVKVFANWTDVDHFLREIYLDLDD